MDRAREASFSKRAEVRRRRDSMRARRRAVIRNLLYLLSLLVCLAMTSILWVGGSGPDLFRIYLAYGALWVALRLSDSVPFAKPRPNIASGVAIGAWALGMVLAGADATSGGELGAFAALAIPSVLLLPVVLRRGFQRRVRTRRWVGVALVVGALLLGVNTLTDPGAPEVGGGMGLTVSGVNYGTPGLAVRLDVYPHGCDRTDASLNVYGTREFWEEVHWTGKRIRLQLIVPDGSASNINVEAVSNPNVAFEDTTPGYEMGSPFPTFRNGSPVFVHQIHLPVGLRGVTRSGGYEVVDAWVSPRWPKVRTPVRFSFQPHWLRSAGLKKCYLQTPALIGPHLWPVYYSSVWKSIDVPHLAVPAVGNVLLHDAGYIAGASEPTSTNGDSGLLTWSCGEDAVGSSSVPEKRVETYPVDAYRESPGHSCAEVTSLEEPTAASFNDLVVFLVGGLVSLGLTMLVISERQIAGVKPE